MIAPKTDLCNYNAQKKRSVVKENSMEKYEELKLEVVAFECGDVVTDSFDTDYTGPWDEDIGNNG